MTTSNRRNTAVATPFSLRPRWLVATLAVAMACVIAPAHAQTYVEAPFFGANAPQAGEWMSNNVAISGDGKIALVGASTYSVSDESYFTGRAQVFTRDAGGWRETAILTDAQGGTAHSFGTDVALSADGWTALVSSQGNRTGIIYAYNPVLGTWSERARLRATDPNHQITGSDVALSGDGATAVVAARDLTNNRPIALVFKPDPRMKRGPWLQKASLAPTGPMNPSGADLDISDDGSTIVVTPWGAANPGNYDGAYYVFRNVQGNWQQEARLVPAAPLDAITGAQLSADGNTMVAGTYRVEAVTQTRGSAVVYKRNVDTGVWTTGPAALRIGGNTLFGMCVQISGDGSRVLVAAPRGGTTGAGMAYVYDVDSATGALSLRQTLVPGMTESSLYYGRQCAMSLDGEALLAVAPGAHGGEGVIYPYHFDSGLQAVVRK